MNRLTRCPLTMPTHGMACPYLRVAPLACVSPSTPPPRNQCPVTWSGRIGLLVPDQKQSPSFTTGRPVYARCAVVLRVPSRSIQCRLRSGNALRGLRHSSCTASRSVGSVNPALRFPRWPGVFVTLRRIRPFPRFAAACSSRRSGELHPRFCSGACGCIPDGQFLPRQTQCHNRLSSAPSARIQ